MSKEEQCINEIEEIIEELKSARNSLEFNMFNQAEDQLIKALKKVAHTMWCVNDVKP